MVSRISFLHNLLYPTLYHSRIGEFEKKCALDSVGGISIFETSFFYSVVS